MSLYIASLNSGSNGNSYYIGNDTEAVLVDAGISCRETEKRMRRLGLSMKKLKAIFISHEHTDHIKGLARIAEKYFLPVYVTGDTCCNCGTGFNPGLARALAPHAPVQVGQLTVTAFPKHHDAADPVSFIITGSGVTIGVFTDIGMACEQVIKYFRLCHAAFLEANYDEDMLENGRYPYHLKNRIRGGKGHLSNSQALQIFTTHRPAFMTHLLLSHLSKENNDPAVVKQLFDSHSKGTEVVVASRYEQSAIYHIQGPSANNKVFIRSPAGSLRTQQLSLFSDITLHLANYERNH
jgi:phosphoribosyl 1,2-cyclic phosphodiesterase